MSERNLTEWQQLHRLTREEPEWAANRINTLEIYIEKLRTENACLRADLIAAKPDEYAEELRREEMGEEEPE